MNTRITRTLVFALLLAAGGPALTGGGACFAKAKKVDVWLARENMVNRFGAEWYKIGMLNRELSGITDVLEDLRDLELFPSELTGLDKSNLLRFDRKIERMEKQHTELKAAVGDLRPPLLDGMGILREMVVREPVESMFDVLEQGDMARITEMLGIKHEIDTLWRSTDTLLTTVMMGIGITLSQPKPTSGFTEEFFTILRANLGEQSAPYYQKLNRIKDTLVNRASAQNVKEMYSIETHRIKGYVKTNNILIAARKIAEVEARYRDRVALGDLSLLAARIAMLQGDYRKALAVLPQAPPDVKTGAAKTLLRLQSLYALHQYDTIWQESERLDFQTWKGGQRNLLLWIAMESGLALKKADVYAKIASQVDRSAPYAIHVMHALGRSYIAEGDASTALSVFESASKFPVRSEMDKVAAKELRIVIAETNYELGRYQKALDLFYELLSEEADFERSLYGILWCYLALDMNDKAETTLRKLINQAPESADAADAFLILARRYLNKAQYEWKKVLYLTKEEQRLAQMIERLEKKQKFDSTLTGDKKFVEAKRDLVNLLGRLRAEPRDSYEAIEGYYSGIGRIGDLVGSYYSTGSFQKVAFTEKREQLLHYLDSVMQAASSASSEEKTSATVWNKRQEITAIKKIVAQGNVFSTEALIERYRFEREYISWQKSQLNYRQQALLLPYQQRNDSASQAKIEAEKKKFSHALDSLITAEENLKGVWYDRLTSHIEAALAGPIGPADAAYFHYQLGELYYADENGRYSKEYEKFDKSRVSYEQKMALYTDGKLDELPVEPAAPRIDHSNSSEQFKQVLRQNASPDMEAAAHYSLAWCWNDLGAFDSALAHMEIVSNDYPKSTFAPQAFMYAGEYMFDKGNLPKAIQCYQSVMKYPESEWFDEALYKLAWSQYRQSNPEKAISSFLALVDLGEGSTGKALLEKESMDYIAISFSEADMTGEKGLERATLFAKKLDDPDRGSQILHRLAKVYRDQGRYELSRKTYRTLLKMNPAYRNMPEVEYEFLATLERDAPPEEANRMKIDFYKKYCRGSDWAKNQTDAETIFRADSLAEGELYDAAIGYHQMSLQKNDTAAYTRALAVYTDFIRAYPKSNRASECHYNLAEIEFSLGHYLKAAEEYITVSRRYPDSKFRETAAWNAIVASQNLLKLENTPR